MSDPQHLHILWTTADPVTAEKMVFMYGINSKHKGWWDQVTIIIWGAPALLAADNRAIQEKIREALDAGVVLSACKACTDQLGVTDTLANMGITATYWGEPLTRLIKQRAYLITV